MKNKILYRLETFPTVGIYSISNISKDACDCVPYNIMFSKVSACRDIVRNIYGTLGATNHPSPVEDKLLVETVCDLKAKTVPPDTTNSIYVFQEVIEHFRFGFGNLKQLHAWFNVQEVLVEFAKIGVMLCKYFSKNVCVGSTQAVIPQEDVFTNNAIRIQLKKYLENPMSINMK